MRGGILWRRLYTLQQGTILLMMMMMTTMNFFAACYAWGTTNRNMSKSAFDSVELAVTAVKWRREHWRETTENSVDVAYIDRWLFVTRLSVRPVGHVAVGLTSNNRHRSL